MAKFTKQHYEILASVLNSCIRAHPEIDIEHVVRKLSYTLETYNSQFDPDKFYAAVHK